MSRSARRLGQRDHELDSAVLGHAERGVRLQIALRLVLVGFIVLTIAVVPPGEAVLLGAVLAGLYAVGALVFGWWARRGGATVVRWAWLALLVDLAVLGSLALITGVSAQDSWTADVLINGCFLLPVLAATQLRPGVCTAVVVPTVAVYVATSVATQAANDEPWAAVVARTLLLAGLGAGCIALSRIQRSRVATIADLLRDRTALLADLVELSERERRELSEQLHDGALQYVLSARQDLDDVRTGTNPVAVERIDEALTETSRLLRSTVSELHPTVLEHGGLARAVADLARAQVRPDRRVELDLERWPPGHRGANDAVLYAAARELVTNVVKHAGATSMGITLELDGDVARLEVTDDGRGMDDEARRRALEHGHIGLHSQALRVEAAGGALTFAPGHPRGTVARVELPADGSLAASSG